MTYSIVARDPVTGELGVAVQSHWFGVGPIVPWARPGVGAVATQANVEVAYGPRGLDLLAAGASAPEALQELVARDPHRASRQVAIVDAHGTVAARTGEGCMAFAGDVQGEGVSCQANIMARATVWPAMLDAYAAATGDLADRLLAALDAAEAQGGDLRGRQSAAILVVPASGDSWDTVVSLRVEDDPDPLAELARLFALHGAYRLAGRADECVAAGRHDEAAPLYVAAAEQAPDADELRFWAGLGAAHGGDMDGAVAHLRAAVACNPGWLELLGRLSAQDAPAARALRERLGGGGRSTTGPAAPPG
ncbi:MAG TPA: DUF1028 domain-containing protein [Solirubrobacteraceae bacterium]|jgi:uncharacterized Ntn-hydrolase superfamily protein|nr:DUF1028 domain-containing protein [Solirubrobacteraceae bacterium]